MLAILVAQAADTITPLAMESVDYAALQNEAAAAAVATSGVAAIGIGVLIFSIIAGLIGLIFLIWWIVLLVDLAKREFPAKTTYLILMILAFFLGFIPIMDLVYYFAVVRKGVGTKKA